MGFGVSGAGGGLDGGADRGGFWRGLEHGCFGCIYRVAVGVQVILMSFDGIIRWQTGKQRRLI